MYVCICVLYIIYIYIYIHIFPNLAVPKPKGSTEKVRPSGAPTVTQQAVAEELLQEASGGRRTLRTLRTLRPRKVLETKPMTYWEW